MSAQSFDQTAGDGTAASADAGAAGSTDAGAAARASAGTAATKHTPQLIEKNGILPAQGVVILTLKDAKGLEFDHVILADAQEASYPSTGAAEAMSKRELYTAISRATRTLDIVSQGQITGLLENQSQKN